MINIEYKTKFGNIVIEQENDSRGLGDKVFKDGKIAPDGKYRLGFMSHIIVKEGEIISF